MDKQTFINEKLIPAVFERADDLFREKIEFSTYKRGWRSKTHANGLDTDPKFTTYISVLAPYNVHDFGTGASGAPKTSKDGHNTGVLSLFAELFTNGDKQRAVEVLAERCNLIDDYNQARNTRRKVNPATEQRRVDLLRADAMFTRAIMDENNPTGRRVVAYLLNRGWTMEEIKGSGIGAIDIDIKTTLEKEMKNTAGHTIPRLPFLWNGHVGKVHTLTIPLLCNEVLDRFQFRHLDDFTNVGKYNKEKATTNDGHHNPFSDKTRLFGWWNMVPTASNIVVEGVMDYVHARAVGINVLCSEGRPSPEQIMDATKRRANTFVLLFDADTAGWGYTRDMAEPLLRAGKTVKVAQLPPLDGVEVKEKQADGNTAVVVRDGVFFNDLDAWLCAVNKKMARTGETNKQPYIEMFMDAVEKDAEPYAVWRAHVLERSLVLQTLVCDPQHTDVNKITAEVVERVGATIRNNQRDIFVDTDMVNLFATTDPTQLPRVTDGFTKWEKALKFDIKAQKDKAVEEARKQKENATASTYGPQDGTDDGVEVQRAKLVPTATNFSDVLTMAQEIEDGTPTMFAFPGSTTDGVADYVQHVQFYPGLTLLCANTGHGKTSILNAVALWDAGRNKKLQNNKVTIYLSFEIEKAVIIADMLNLYNNDPELSNNPTATLRTYFSKKLHGTPYADMLFNKETIKSGDGVGLTHYQHFANNMDTFFNEYLTVGGHLHVVKANWTYETLLDGLKWYIEQLRVDPTFQGKQISMVCIDYAQLLYTQTPGRQRTEEIKQIVKGLNDLAKDPTVFAPFVMCAQFNQQVTNPAKIAVNCIGEGGDFSRYADTVIGFYNLEKLTATDAMDTAVVKDMADVGLVLPKGTKKKDGDDGTDDGLRKGELKNLMFARLLKTRNGAFPRDTLLLWDGRLKKIFHNCNRYVADTELSTAEGVGFTDAVTKGHNELMDIATRMMEAAGVRKKTDATVDTFVGSLSQKVMDGVNIDIKLKQAMEEKMVAEGDMFAQQPVAPSTPTTPPTGVPVAPSTPTPPVGNVGMFDENGNPLPTLEVDDLPF